jgi:hypothetical protein
MSRYAEAINKYNVAMNLLRRAVDSEIQAPDVDWFKDFFTLSGDHMILSDEGWECGSAKQSYIDEFGPDSILDEVNAPEVPA